MAFAIKNSPLLQRSIKNNVRDALRAGVNDVFHNLLHVASDAEVVEHLFHLAHHAHDMIQVGTAVGAF